MLDRAHADEPKPPLLHGLVLSYDKLYNADRNHLATITTPYERCLWLFVAFIATLTLRLVIGA